MDLRAKCNQILYLVAVQLEQDLFEAGVVRSTGLELLSAWRTAEDALSQVEDFVSARLADDGDVTDMR